MADKVAVMNKGKVIQVGTPREIFENPSHVFVATFVGSPPMNIIECRVQGDKIECPGFNLPVPGDIEELRGKTKLYLGVRPEHVEILEKPTIESIQGKLFLKKH